MKIFISWSGPVSQQIAQEVRNWLPLVLQGIEPFITTSDIEKGAKWQTEIAKELAESSFGIVCLTPQNIDSQWIAFEAGALAKHLEGRVATVLFNLTPNDVSLPLSMFQASPFTKGEMRALVGGINGHLPANLQRPDGQLDKMFDRFWDDLSDAVHLTLQAGDAAPPQVEPSRVEVMAQEMMAMLRQQTTMLSNISAKMSPVPGVFPLSDKHRMKLRDSVAANLKIKMLDEETRTLLGLDSSEDDEITQANDVEKK